MFILIGLIWRGQEGELVHEVLRLANLFEFLSAYSMTFIVIKHVLARLIPSGDNKETRILSLGLKTVFAFQTAVLVLSFFTGFCKDILRNMSCRTPSELF